MHFFASEYKTGAASIGANFNKNIIQYPHAILQFDG